MNPYFTNLLRSVRDIVIKLFFTNYISARDINLSLPIHITNSAGSRIECARLAILSAQQTFPLIYKLQNFLGNNHPEIIKIESFISDDLQKIDAKLMADLFNQFGSDKSSVHNYHLFYAYVLSNIRPNHLSILEIGVGTNNVNLVSNMGEGGQPGASLRAFREYLPNSDIYGADIDKEILFQEERIKTYYVDQNDMLSFNALSDSLENIKFDLIIDDGLHSPSANISTLLFALNRLKLKGWVVIEDISEASLPIWEVVARILSNSYSPKLIKAKEGFIFAIQNQ